MKQDLPDDLAEFIAKSQRRDEEIVDATTFSPDVTDDGTPEPDAPTTLTARQLRIARDARRATKDAPVYIKLASERVGRKRAAEVEGSKVRGMLVFGIIPTRVPIEEWHERSAQVKARSDAEAAEVRQKYIDATAEETP